MLLITSTPTQCSVYSNIVSIIYYAYYILVPLVKSPLVVFTVISLQAVHYRVDEKGIRLAGLTKINSILLEIGSAYKSQGVLGQWLLLSTLILELETELIE